MTVKELKEKLSQYPDSMDVFLDERTTDFTFGLVNSVEKKKVTFSEDPDYITEVNAEAEVLVLSED